MDKLITGQVCFADKYFSVYELSSSSESPASAATSGYTSAGVVSTGSSMCSFWARLELGLTQPLREVSVGWAAQSGALDAVSESAASEGYMGGWIAADDEEPARWQALEEAGAEAARSRGRRLVGRMETPRQRGLV